MAYRRLLLRLPDSMHRALADQAERDAQTICGLIRHLIARGLRQQL